MQTFYFHGTEINAELISRHVGNLFFALFCACYTGYQLTIRRYVGG